MEGKDFLSLIHLQHAREENERLKRAVNIKQANGLYYYRPHAKQHKFHICQATGRYGRTGNRFGKSEMGIAEDLAWCMGGRVWYREAFDILRGNRTTVERHPGGRNHPYITQGIPKYAVKGLIIVVDWEMASRIFTNCTGAYETWGKLFKLLPKHLVGDIKTVGRGHISEIEIIRPEEFGGGSSVLTIDTIEAYKHNRMGAESADWDFIHVDEPCPEKLFKAHARGLMDRGGKFWFNCTPLDQMWINDMFTPKKAGAIQDTGPDGLLFETKDAAGKRTSTRFIITGSIYDNPHRNDAGVSEFESTLTKDEIDCRLNGRPAGMAGAIYKEFCYDDHVLQSVPEGWVSYEEPPLSYTVRLWFDYHIRKPQAVLFFATDPQDRVYVYMEMFEANLIEDVALGICKRIQGYFVADMDMDPLAFIEHPVTQETIQDELLKYGLYFEKATKDMRRGILAVRERLKERDPQGKPTIFFSPNLVETLYEFDHYVYKPDTEDPKDEHDHMMENLGRAMLNGLRYIRRPDMSELEHRRPELSIGLAEDRVK